MSTTDHCICNNTWKKKKMYYPGRVYQLFMGFKKAYGRVQVGKYLFDMFPVKNDFQQHDASRPNSCPLVKKFPALYRC
jgi:hypothetical protein